MLASSPPLWILHQLFVLLALAYGVWWALAGAGPGRRPFRLHVALSAVAAGTVASVWLLFADARGDWVMWPLLGLALALALHDPARELARRGALALHAGVAATAMGVTTAVWLLTGTSGNWILWPLLGVGTALAAHAVIAWHLALARGIRQASGRK